MVLIVRNTELQLLSTLLSHNVVFEGLRWNGQVVGAGTQGLVCRNRWVSCGEGFIGGINLQTANSQISMRMCFVP
jgi:hypothetical protein